MVKCIYCDDGFFERNKGSKEHAILSSLGGRKISRNICCQACNNRLGKQIDDPLSDNYSFFSTMLDITTGRNKPAPVQKQVGEHQGRSFDIKPGGEIKFSKNDVQISNEGDRTKFAIKANSVDEALKIIEGKLAGRKLSAKDIAELNARSVKSYTPKVGQRLAFGGSEQFRSIAKMALTYLATSISHDRLRCGIFKGVIDFINGKDVENNFVSYTNEAFPSTLTGNSEVDHRLVIASSEESKQVHAVLELYGNIRYFIVLTNDWNGPSLSKTYTVDPVTKKTNELEKSHTEEIFKFVHKDSITDEDYKSLQENVEKIAGCFQKRQSDCVIDKMINDAVKQHIEGKGDVITEEMISELSRSLALDAVRMIYRIDSEEDIDLRQYLLSNESKKEQ